MAHRMLQQLCTADAVSDVQVTLAISPYTKNCYPLCMDASVRGSHAHMIVCMCV